MECLIKRTVDSLLSVVHHIRCSPIYATYLLVAGSVALCVALCGCRTPTRSIDVAREAFFAGDLQASRATLGEVIESNRRWSDASQLDLAIVDLADGNPRAAEQRLRQMRESFDALPAAAPLHEAASLVSDDTARPFRPAGYEEVMVRALLAVCSLAGDGADAESYCLQAAMKQSELARQAGERGLENADELYRPIALAPYMRGVLREASHRDYDDAAAAYQLVSAASPQFAPIGEDIRRASEGVHSAPGHGVLYVIACVGRGPRLVETVAPTTTASLQIASTILQSVQQDAEEDEGGFVLPNIASVKVPAVDVPQDDLTALGVSVNGQLFGATQTLTDVAQLAREQVEAEMPWTIARAVARRVTKEATVAGAGKGLGLQGNAASLFQFAAASAWSGTEHADTRCWGLLPREIQVLRAELPAGQHQIGLTQLNHLGHPMALPQVVDAEIVDGRNRYVIVIAPGPHLFVVCGEDER
ncbi:hypothetical protein [Stieleria varia]|uniref:Uncharacterized protein n=1 Tax=Stieleria varia TaxID=2528005 RepID=A0A5C6BAR9_9BACT|nr:hypothetical protein [Stieleria varia]TWU07604.1 hypothetical protein Pla52n_01770 [Stieleria varia]